MLRLYFNHKNRLFFFFNRGDVQKPSFLLVPYILDGEDFLVHITEHRKGFCTVRRRVRSPTLNLVVVFRDLYKGFVWVLRRWFFKETFAVPNRASSVDHRPFLIYRHVHFFTKRGLGPTKVTPSSHFTRVSGSIWWEDGASSFRSKMREYLTPWTGGCLIECTIFLHARSVSCGSRLLSRRERCVPLLL